MSAGPLFVQRVTIRNVFDPTVIQDEPLFCHHVFKFIHINLNTSPLLGDVDLPSARALELGLAEGLSRMLLVLQLGEDGYILLMRMTWKGWRPTWM